MTKATKVTPEKEAEFLDALADIGSVKAAAEATQIHRNTWYEHRRDCPDFAARWEEALTLGVDALEDEATRRAIVGTEEPVYQGGKQVGTIRKFSDTLLIFMLKARRPEKFKDRAAVEHSAPVQDDHDYDNMPLDELRRLARGE